MTHAEVSDGIHPHRDTCVHTHTHTHTLTHTHTHTLLSCVCATMCARVHVPYVWLQMCSTSRPYSAYSLHCLFSCLYTCIPATICMQTSCLPLPSPCSLGIPSLASGRTNLELKKYLSGADASPGSLAMAGFRTTAQTEIKAKNDERARASKTPERTLKEPTPPRSADAGPVHHKTPVSSPRQPATKQRTPERNAGPPKPKNGSVLSATRHFLPRQSPKRVSSAVPSVGRTTQAPAQKVSPLKRITHKAAADGGEVRMTALRGSKSPPLSPPDSQQKPTVAAQQASTPSPAKSRLPQPSSSRIPTPGSAGRSGKPSGNR